MFKDNLVVPVSVIFLGIAIWSYLAPKYEAKNTSPAIVPIVRETPPQATELTSDQIRDMITPEKLREHLTFLSSDRCAGRKPGTEGWKLAKEYVSAQFIKYKLEPVTGLRNQFFNIGDIRTENTVGCIPGNGPHKDEVIIICAHLDHLGQRGNQIYHGADDNGSGSVGLLGAAEALAKVKLDRTVLFISFSGEEMGLLGSRHYVEHPLLPLSKTVAVFNLDMIGRFKQNSFRAMINQRDQKKFGSVLNEAMRYSGVNGTVSTSLGGGSDHVPFDRKGVSVCFFHTGLHANYHQPSDTVEKIDFQGLTNITKCLFHAVLKFDQENRL